MRRLVSGLLTASMVLSLISSTGISASAAEPELKTATPVSHGIAVEARSALARASKYGGGDVSMPLVLDKSSIGFTADSDMVEVTAYMTDIQYLSLLTLDEYAAFIPVTVDLDKVTYLDHESREYIASISEEKRMELRAQAVNKLQLEEQFIWEAFWDETDYSDELEITPVDWFIVDAKAESAPMIGCKAEIRWTGEKKVNYVQDTSSDGFDFSSLLGETGTSGESGSRSIYDESPEVQEFMREMYMSGLTQENSPYYDFDEFIKNTTSGEQSGGQSTESSFNLMGGTGTQNEMVIVTET